MRIILTINNINKEVEIMPGDVLYDVIKKSGVSSVKKSCGTASCGVCTVLLDGKPIPSCSYLAAKADGHNITTIEGIQAEADMVGGMMNEEGAIQCGFCTPGFLLTVIAMKRELENPTEEEMKNYLVGNLCRCSGYEGQLRAVKRYLEVSR
ncbi:MAG: (2Fe-2S)-binding protein [Clostridiales bacterium GWB2_37_7]|nr:MAG: (2Fe-2S)-binding protein [Clostridiales bacterium GWB2_37_7]